LVCQTYNAIGLSLPECNYVYTTDNYVDDEHTGAWRRRANCEQKGESFVPLLLKPIGESNPHWTLYEAKPWDSNRLQMVVRHIPGHTSQYEFRLSAERIGIALRVTCASAEQSVPLATSFSLQNRDDSITTVVGNLEYGCKGDTLRTN
jgi:hypothetical protein